MNKKCCRFFGGFIASQAKWLNKMSENGFRLIGTGKLTYEFEECEPNQYKYCVEFIGHKSKAGAEDYARFLEDCGYRVFFKNINLNWNFGKTEVRPWAEKGGRLASNSTTFNRELLIVEKKNDGKPFELHTSFEDKIVYLNQLRRPWIYMFIVSFSLGIAMRALIWGIFALISAAGIIMSQVELKKLKESAKYTER